MKVRSVIGSVLFLGAVATATWAQDAQKIAPEVYKCVLENDRVRVCEITFSAGTKVPFHSHPDHVTVVSHGGSVEVTDETGKVHNVTLPVNKPLWGPRGGHSAANVGTSDIKGFVIELK